MLFGLFAARGVVYVLLLDNIPEKSNLARAVAWGYLFIGACLLQSYVLLKMCLPWKRLSAAQDAAHKQGRLHVEQCQVCGKGKRNRAAWYPRSVVREATWKSKLECCNCKQVYQMSKLQRIMILAIPLFHIAACVLFFAVDIFCPFISNQKIQAIVTCALMVSSSYLCGKGIAAVKQYPHWKLCKRE